MSIRFGSAPDAAEHPAQIARWALGSELYEDGALTVTEMTSTLRSLEWHAVTATQDRWNSDPRELARCTDSLLTGLWQIDAPLGLHVRGGRTGLQLFLGAHDGTASNATITNAAALSVVQANFGGIEIDPAKGVWRGTPADHTSRALKLVVDAGAEIDVGTRSMIERLESLSGVHWQLDVLLVPIPSSEIATAVTDLDALETALAGSLTHQVQLDPHTTLTNTDPVVARVADVVRRRQERARVAGRSGAFGVAVVLSAPTPTDLAAAVGAATATSSDGVDWHPAGFVASELIPVTAATCKEAVDAVRLPTYDVLGLPCRRYERLDEHPEAIVGRSSGPTVQFGRTDKGGDVVVPLDVLGHHLLVTGASGFGKSSFVANLAQQIVAAGTPVMVVEPVKQEWHALAVPGLVRWAIGAPDPGMPWRLNPLEVPEGTAVATHCDHLVALFRTAFGLPDPLPHLVELGLHRVYAAAGWDLGSDRHFTIAAAGRADVEWPTISDLLEECRKLPAELRYDRQVQGNLLAALEARLGNLTRGARGRLLDTADVFPIDDVLGTPVLVNLDHIGDDHARSFVMGLLVLRLAEARRGSSTGGRLVHVAVIEEAHRLMGRHTSQPPATGGIGGADPVGGGAEMFGNLLSEIRASGQGLVICDQSPNALVRAAIVNTGTKVALRSADRDDQETLGSAFGLPPDKQQIFTSLRKHEALVVTEGYDSPVLTRLAATHLVTTPVPKSVDSAPLRLPAGAADVRRAASVHIRSGAADEAATKTALFDAIAAEFPGIGPTARAELFADAVDTAVSAVARRHRWTRSERLAAVDAVMSRRHDATHPHARLARVRQPFAACRSVCPHGGCIVGDLVEPEAAALQREGPAIYRNFVNDPKEAWRRLERRAVAAVGPHAPTELTSTATGCAAVQLFDDWAARDTVGLIVRRIMAVPGEGGA